MAKKRYFIGLAMFFVRKKGIGMIPFIFARINFPAMSVSDFNDDAQNAFFHFCELSYGEGNSFCSLIFCCGIFGGKGNKCLCAGRNVSSHYCVLSYGGDNSFCSLILCYDICDDMCSTCRHDAPDDMHRVQIHTSLETK